VCCCDGNAHRREISPWFVLVFGLARDSEPPSRDFRLSAVKGLGMLVMPAWWCVLCYFFLRFLQSKCVGFGGFGNSRGTRRIHGLFVFLSCLLTNLLCQFSTTMWDAPLRGF
jgi:hypothetical protein